MEWFFKNGGENFSSRSFLHIFVLSITIKDFKYA